MLKYRILFSKTNVESRFLALMLQDKLENEPELREGEQWVKPIVTMIDYRRETDYAPTQAVDDTFIVGVELHANHLLRELQNTVGIVKVYAYDEQYGNIVEVMRTITKLSDTEVDRIVISQNLTNTVHRRKLQPGDSVENSKPFHFTVLGEYLTRPDKQHVRLLAEKIEAYQALETLDKEDLVLVNEVVREMDLNGVQSLEAFKPSVFLHGMQTAIRFKDLLVKRATTASYIERTLRNQWIGAQGKGRMMLNMMMPREHVVYAARLLSYAHDRFMMYEDGNNCRIWTIVAPTVYEAQGIAGLLKPHDVWCEKGFVHCITDLPKIA